MGGWDKGNTPWRRILRSKIRKIAAAKKEAAKARAGKNSFPLPPSFFPARAEKFFRNQNPDFRQKKFGF